MARIHIPFFEGVVPKKSGHLLKDTEARDSSEARLDRGRLDGWNELSSANSTFKPSSSVNSIYPHENGWLFWDNEGVDVARSPVLDDEYDRLYYTGDGYPKISYRGLLDLSTHDARGTRLGIPAPKSAPRVDLGDRSEVTGDAEFRTRNYAYTFVSADGKETALSRPTTGIQQSNGDDTPISFSVHPKVNGNPKAAGGSTEWSLGPTDVRRLYRAGSDSSKTAFDTLTANTYNATQVDSRTIKLTFNHGTSMTMEHMLNSTDVATFRYNGDDYTATMGHNSSPSNLITYLEDATLNSDNNITFGSGLLSVTVEASSDKTSTSVTVTTKASTATLSNVSYIANSHYWHIADIPLNTTTYNDDMLGSRGAEDYSGKGKFIPPGTGTSETTLWMAGTDPARPLSAPNFSGVTSVLADSEEDRSYVYTYANFMGEEGPPSNPSDIVTVQNGGTVFVTFEDDVDYNYNLHGGGSSIKEVAWSSTVADPTDPTDPVIVTTPIEGGGEHVDLTLTEGLSFNSTLSAKADTPDNPAFRLLYRTSSGTTGVEFQLVAALDINDLVFEDTVANTKLGESLRSTGWRPPPEDLKGLKVLPNGFLAGFSGRSLGFSEAYMPHAWPQGYEIKFSEHIVGLGVTGNSLVVLTQGFPYLVTGDSPDSMSAVRVESAQACASRYSIVDMGDSVVYASPDGLVSVGESGTDVLTQDMLTRAQWQEYGPDDMVGFLYEGYYIGSSIAAGKSFIMSADGKLSTLSGVFKTSYQDYEQDRLYVLDDGGLKVFNEGPRRKVTWLSKEFRFQSPTNLGVLKVLGNGNCLVRIRGDGNLLDINPDASVKTELVVGGGGDIVRLPGGNAYLEYQIELSTFGSVETVTLASSVGELTSA